MNATKVSLSVSGDCNDDDSSQVVHTPGRGRTWRCSGMGTCHVDDSRAGGDYLAIGRTSPYTSLRNRDRTNIRNLDVESDRGSAVVEFLLVSILVVVLVMAVLQLALALHVRNILIDSVGEGARYGALADSSPTAGVERARVLIAGALSHRYAENISYQIVDISGQSVLEMTASTPIPVVGLVGPTGSLTVKGRAVIE